MRSKCEVSQNRAKFWTVFALPHSKVPPKLYSRYHACLPARHVEKFCAVAELDRIESEWNRIKLISLLTEFIRLTLRETSA